MTAFLKFSGKIFALSLNQDIQNLILDLFQRLQINSQELIFQSNGKIIHNFQNINKLDTVYATIPLVGGKGGFGAKLKNQGGKKIRPNDNKFSRDAQGRRIEFQMAQKQYTQYIKKKIEQDQKVNQERQKFRVMQQTMKQGNSFMKLDRKYHQQVQQAQNKLSQSIKIGRQRLVQKKLKQLQKQMKKRSLQLQQQQKIQICQNEYIDKECIQKGQIFSQNDLKRQQQEKQELGNIQKPVKKIKTQVLTIELKQQIKELKIQKPTIASNQTSSLSAKDKLKSLFKK